MGPEQRAQRVRAGPHQCRGRVGVRGRALTSIHAGGGDELFDTAAPRVSLDGAREICRSLFGVDGDVTPLPSERDRNFLIHAGDQSAVLKLSHPAEDAAVVLMENAAMAHVARTDPALPIPRVVPTIEGDLVATATGQDGRRHLTRLITVLPGRPAEGTVVSPRLASDIGAATARMSIALRGFFHPAAGRTHVWDVRRVAALAPHLSSIHAPDRAALVAESLEVVAAELALVERLPAQVEHADVTLTNVLIEGDELLGLIDFGDMHHTATVCDLAAGLTSVLRSVASGGPSAVVETAGAYLEGYQRHRPLLVEEAATLGSLVRARLVATVLISAWRGALHPDNTTYIQQYDDSSWTLLRLLADELDATAMMTRLAGTGRIARPEPSDSHLLERRRKVTGGSLSPLFYQRPITMRRAAGAYMYDDEGRRYLDAYNNVPVLGHSHPTVVQAVTAQMRVLTTNSRYLHPHPVELAERLLATMPAGAGLDTCILVNSGTEAVDLAWRLAVAATGGDGALIVEHSYHGISDTVADFSSNEWPEGYRPQHVETFAAPHDRADGTRPSGADAEATVARAVERLTGRGHRPALLLLDPMFTSEGILDAPPSYLRAIRESAHAAGALVLADEVQSGFGRTGPQLWAFARGGLVPDLVTLGKPMGNGYPVAAVLTRSDIAAAMGSHREYFNTFAGGPVPAAAALAVLDVLQDSRIPEHAAATGDYLREQLRALAEDHPMLGDVRGFGLIAGVDVHPAPGVTPRAAARTIVEALRDEGVLIGATGQDGGTLKIRPPLIWTPRQVDELVTALRRILGTIETEEQQ